jgi:quinol monooxygenase YgiN
MSIHVTAEFQVTKEAVGSIVGAIERFVSNIQDTEPGTLIYRSLQNAEDETKFLHEMEFKDDSAREAHQQSQGTSEFVEILYPRCVAGPEFTDYREVSAAERERL